MVSKTPHHIQWAAFLLIQFPLYITAWLCIRLQLSNYLSRWLKEKKDNAKFSTAKFSEGLGWSWQQEVDDRKFWVSKNFVSKKLLGPQIFWNRKQCWVRKMLVQKKFGQKNFGSKIFLTWPVWFNQSKHNLTCHN